MTCAPYITQPGAVIGADEPVAQAVRLLAANGFVPLPVVDGNRRVAGIFGPRELATLLLPMGARLAGDSFDLGFVSETPRALHERLADEGQSKVAAHAGTVDPIRADTSLDEALLRFHRGEILLIVADDAGRLAGIISAAALLAPLAEGC